MARRTKEDALATRDALLDAAERMFERQGVASTTLQAIAAEAGVTRGAVYWHFRDKADLFSAMLARAKLPFERNWAELETRGHQDPLGQLHELLFECLRQTPVEPRLRCAFDIVTLKVEFVGELDALRQRRLTTQARLIELTAQLLRRAQALDLVRPDVDPLSAAHGIHALACGLLQNWIMDSSRFDLVEVSRAALDTFIAGLCRAPAVAQAENRPARTRLARAGKKVVVQKSSRRTPSEVPRRHKLAL